jgi:DNA-directed RNA polymerase subunit beta
MAANMLRQAIPPFINQRPLVASGIERSIFLNSPSTIKAQEKGQVEYVDSQQIIIKESNKEKRTYHLNQLVVSNKNTLGFSLPLVKKGDEVEKGQIIAGSNYSSNNEMSLGYNLRVAYLC